MWDMSSRCMMLLPMLLCTAPGASSITWAGVWWGWEGGGERNSTGGGGGEASCRQRELEGLDGAAPGEGCMDAQQGHPSRH